MLHRLSSFLVVIALAVAGMIPAGWMPTAGEDGRMLLVICTSDGTVEQWVDLDTDDNHTPADPMEDRSCPFGALGTHIVLNDTPLDIIDQSAPLMARWADQPFTHASAGFYTRYDARGPPATLS